MAKITASDLNKIKAKHAAIQELGTPEKGYTDAGVWEFLNYVYTKDSHDHDQPVKKLLGEDDRYIVVVILYMLACPKLLVSKSRQIRMSWIAVMFALWHAMARPYRLVTFQSKKAEDAEDMVTKGAKDAGKGRCDFMIQRLPRWLADPYILSGTGNKVGTLAFSPQPTDVLTGAPIPWCGSQIESMPEGAHQVRSKTPSLALFDEAAYHDGFEEAVGAIMPAVSGGGQFVGFSSVEAGSDFNAMVLDGVGENGPVHEVHPVVQRALDILGWEWPKGMRSWPTPSGMWALEVHYTADPHKDPARDGAAWFAEAVAGYRGGVESSRWKTEMEIDYLAGGGDPVFPFARPDSPIYVDAIPPSRALDTMRLYAGYDYGARNPSAFEVWGIDKKGRAYAVWELYEPCLDIADHVAKMKRCPYWDRIEYIACDPSITPTGNATPQGMKAISEQFADYGVHLTPGRRGSDVPVAQLFLSKHWSDPQNPTALITKACPNLWSEVRDLRWDKHISAGVAARKNEPEKIRAKKNHGWDATAYLFNSHPAAFVEAARQKPGHGTFGAAARELLSIAENERRRTSGIQVV